MLIQQPFQSMRKTCYTEQDRYRNDRQALAPGFAARPKSDRTLT